MKPLPLRLISIVLTLALVGESLYSSETKPHARRPIFHDYNLEALTTAGVWQTRPELVSIPRERHQIGAELEAYRSPKADEKWPPETPFASFHGAFTDKLTTTTYYLKALPCSEPHQCILSIQTQTTIKGQTRRPTAARFLVEYDAAWPRLLILKERYHSKNSTRLFRIFMTFMRDRLPPFTQIGHELKSDAVLTMLYRDMHPSGLFIENRFGPLTEENRSRLVTFLRRPALLADNKRYSELFAQWHADTVRLEMHLHRSTTADELLTAFKAAGVENQDVHLTVRDNHVWVVGFTGPHPLLEAAQAPSLLKANIKKNLSDFALAFAMQAHALPPGSILLDIFTHLVRGSVEMEELYQRIRERQLAYDRQTGLLAGWAESAAFVKALTGDWDFFLRTHLYPNDVQTEHETVKRADRRLLNLWDYPALNFVLQAGYVFMPFIRFLEAGMSFLREVEQGARWEELSEWPLFRDAFERHYEVNSTFVQELRFFYDALDKGLLFRSKDPKDYEDSDDSAPEKKRIGAINLVHYRFIGPLYEAFTAEQGRPHRYPIEFTVLQTYWSRILVRNFGLSQQSIFDILLRAYEERRLAKDVLKRANAKVSRPITQETKVVLRQLKWGAISRAVFDYLVSVWGQADPSKSEMSLFSLIGLAASKELFNAETSIHFALYLLATRNDYYELGLWYVGMPNLKNLNDLLTGLVPAISNEEKEIMAWTLQVLRDSRPAGRISNPMEAENRSA